MTRTTTRTLTLALLGLPFFVACGDKDTDDTGDGGGDVVDQILALEGDATAGEAAFATNCSGCHGADGNSGSAPMLSDVAPGLDDAGLVTVMIEGTGNMPAIDLENQDAADILAFVRATF